MATPISPPAVGDDTTGALPAYLSNGLIGLRVRDLPLRNGVAVVSGLSGVHPVAGIEAAARAPYPLGADIRVNRVWCSDLPQRVEGLEQAYDFQCGELLTRFRFVAGDVRAQVEVLAFCSRSQPTLVLQEIQVTVDSPCDLTLRARVDHEELQGRVLQRETGTAGEPEPAVDGSLWWEPLGGISTCGLAYITEFKGDEAATFAREEWGEQSPLVSSYSLRARPGRRYRLRQIASLVPSTSHNQPQKQAVRHAALAESLGFETLQQENHAAWRELWKGRINLVGADERWQALADAAVFYLNSSVHRSSPASTSIFGLAQWHDYHYYYGHVMWDIETFSLPVLLFLQPDAARSLVDFRSRTLPGARANAKLHGYAGIQFPWESGMSTGEESAPGPGSGSWHEDHVTPDVALGFAQYAHATGDEFFLREQAWPVLHGTAEWISSRVERSPRGYELRRSMGIAERKTPSDNVAFMNMAAKVVLDEAIGCARRLGHQVPREWEQIRTGLVLPLDQAAGVMLSHDGYEPSEEKGETPDPLAGIFPLGFDLDPAVEQTTLKYYLRMAKRYVGSPMLSALYGVWAARAGERARSLELLEEGYARFAAGRFLQTLEYRPDVFPEQPQAGPFVANLSGFLLGCLYGLPGLRLNAGEPATWCQRPVILPRGWDAIEVERIWVRGRPARLVARQGDMQARIEIEKGA